MIQNFIKQFPDIFQKIGLVADQCKMELYLVGGYVRDLIHFSDKKNYTDFDFTVVGDALNLAKKLKNEFKTKHLVIYERFGTAMLQVGEYKLEFVTAREESYSQDSRKPTVKKAEKSKILKLPRRVP